MWQRQEVQAVPWRWLKRAFSEPLKRPLQRSVTRGYIQLCDSQIQQAIANYVRARRELLRLGEEFPHRIGGNDNIIGRIGEFLALRFLESMGQSPEKVRDSANPGYDFCEGETLTQVKVISHESLRGRNVRLRQPWTQFVLVELGRDYTPIRIGVLSKDQHEVALDENPNWSASPFVKRTMLGNKGLIGRYGSVYDVDEIPL